MATAIVPAPSVTMQPTRVLVLGGYGFFGKRLVQRLALRPGLHILVAGRSRAKAEALVQELAPGAASALTGCPLDVRSPSFRHDLALLQPTIVVHTAGPFQGQDYGVALACIAAGVHYVDLADGREFVAGIATLDEQARGAGVAVISGASSVPALSSAVVDDLAAGMQAVDSIDIGITPGNRTERGVSTVQSVLSYCGRVIHEDGSGVVHGWSGTWRQRYPAPIGLRLLSPCDVPDLVLLAPRYVGHPRVRFGAGLELPFLHRGMNVMAWLVRKRWVAGWDRHAARLKQVSEWFQHWGTDAGAMHVQVRGRDASGADATREWVLVATDGDGPFVPTLAAAALVLRLATVGTLEPGARPCVGCLTSSEILAQAQGLAITAGRAGTCGLFEQVMGPGYGRLDPAVRAFHDIAGSTQLHGEVETMESGNGIGALLSRVLGAPRRPAQGPLRFELRGDGEQQTWIRHFPHRTMKSTLRVQGCELVEALGPVRLRFGLLEDGGSLVMVLRSMCVAGIPCPAWMLPRIDAREHGSEDRLHFHVQASLPLVGRVAGYTGWLRLPERG